MSTLAVRAPSAPKLWSPLRGVARIGSALLMLLDVFGEAQHQAFEAKQRYPFMTW
jgi:hypothetical protein